MNHKILIPITNRILFLSGTFCFVLTLILFQPQAQAQDRRQSKHEPVDFVNPFIGVLDDGTNCVIGPQLPFGSINPSPETQNGSQDGYSPAEPIRGFGQLHVSGTGWGKYGEVFVSPQIGLRVGETDHDSPKSGEAAKAYEYSVFLTRYKIKVDVTPSYHSAIYRFTFPKSDSAYVLIDITHNIPMDIMKDGSAYVSAGKIGIDTGGGFAVSGEGTYSGGFGDGRHEVFFRAEFNKKPLTYGTWRNGCIAPGQSSDSLVERNDRVGGYLRFATSENEQLFMKIAVSFRCIEQAGHWLSTEIPGWGFDNVRGQARTIWNRELSKIEVEGGSDSLKEIFYTALYHSFLMPHDRTGDMKGYPTGAPLWDDEYAVWDTWRTLFPLMELIDPAMVRGNINSFIERYKKNGVVKDSFIGGIDMKEEQGGNDVDNIIADAFVKGMDGVNWKDAYGIIRHDADFERRGYEGSYGDTASPDSAYRKTGWIPAGIMSCSKTLEYAYNDYCAAEMAYSLGTKADYKKFLTRSSDWENLWDSTLTSDGFRGFISPRKADGWVNIDPKKEWGSWHEYFYEGSSWTYSYFVPHEIEKLVAMCGGKQEYVSRLNHALENGLIDYSNEPAFLVIHSFHYAGRPDLASYWVRHLMKTGYTMTGEPGNDDSGAMGSWFVFAAMGFFPNAGQNLYYLHGPAFSKCTIRLGNGKTITIYGQNANDENIYVHSLTVNGKPWNSPFITHDELKNGATLRFTMSREPSDWGK